MYLRTGDLVRYRIIPKRTGLILEAYKDLISGRYYSKILWDSGRIEEDVWCVDLKRFE